MGNNRKKYLINPKFQLRFMFYMLAICLVTTITYLTLITYFFSFYLKKGQELGLASDHPYFMLLREQESRLLSYGFAFSLVYLLIIVIYGKYLSHKIAGPLYKLQQVLENDSLQKVKENPIRLRKNDFFQELADSFNKFINRS